MTSLALSRALRIAALLGLMLAMSSWFVIARAQDASVHAGSISIDPDSALAATLSRMEGEPLSLVRAVALALANATEVHEARAAFSAAGGILMREKGAFDPELFADVTTSRTESPSSSPFARPDVIEAEETSTTAGARIRFPMGTQIEVAVDARKIDTNSEFASIDPEYRADGRIEVRQPLLKGFGPGTSSGKTAAMRSEEAAQASYRDARLRARSRVETMYWELYAAERDVAVQQLIVGRAEALLEVARLRANAGLVGPNDVANARVFLANQRLSALDKEERLDAISDQLAMLLGTRPEHTPRFRPIDEPPSRFAVDDIDSLLARTNRSNAALLSAERNVAETEARARGAQWNQLPALDLVGSIGGAGLSGTSRDVVFGGDTLRADAGGAYGDALDEVLGRDFPTWSIGFELSMPLPLREGRGEGRRLEAEVERARSRLASIRRSLEAQVRAAHRELVNSRERLEVAREGVAASFEQVRIGLIEYDNGRTTAFELVHLGSDLAESQQRLSEALVRVAKAAADLRYLIAESTESLNKEPSE